ncbi:helix-turn-helix domain-containing protein [Streptomyces sp. RS10V-4]|uniref:helix-turn-helix domain-containing protein n=1 Tax=Streptomyces rhizoryzae TaxID=2932493 RepID=UPI0020034FE4|nr:helix-turn-helix domain-containing protein [Streptomyces rhizoryzae]MCK7622039.1 helix-turn-helix domain-containing protein [Streptomyces rhizoryzae]
MRFHDTNVRHQAVARLRAGAKNADVARALGVPVGTIGYWRHMDRAERGECPGRHDPPCPRCDGRGLDEAAYAYLLALYLGDGHVIQYSGHRVPSLMITCSNDWPGLMDRCEAAMRAVFPENSVCRVSREGCHNVKVYSKHLWCMFPQHGPGKKHERPIALEEWQQTIVEAHPWEFIRGLVHSDGCRITNWTTRTVGGERKRYEYPRYFFTNTSADILRLCTDTLDRVGVAWKHTRQSRAAKSISVAQRASVALMDAHIGPKY